MSASSRTRTTFLSVAAQPDNLGDAEIRAVAVEFAARAHARLHVYVGSMPDSYVRCVELPPEARRYTSALRFALSLLLHVARGGASLMLSPGPYVLPSGAKRVRSWGLYVLAVLLTRRGGALVSVGRALHAPRGFSAAERRLAGLADVFTVRDHLSAEVFGRPVVDVVPDLGLSPDRSADAGPKDRVVLSFRSDRDLPVDFLERLVASARSSGLEPVFVTQVMRDDAQHVDLGERLGVEVVEWGTRAHDDQLARVRDAMSAAAWVVTDRLHSAIFGVQWGASPVAVVRSAPDKLVNCLDFVLPLPTLDPSVGEVDLPWLDQSHHSSVRRSVASARAEIDALALSVVSTLDGGPANPDGVTHD